MKGRGQEVRKNLPGPGAWQPGNRVHRRTRVAGDTILCVVDAGASVWTRGGGCAGGPPGWMCQASKWKVKVEVQRQPGTGDGVWEASTWLTAEGSSVSEDAKPPRGGEAPVCG